MRRTPLNRALAAMMALWLAVVLGEPAALHHHCPMHDGTARSASMPMHAAHGASHSPARDEGSHGCTCVGDCCAVGGTAVLASQPGIPEAAIRATRHANRFEHSLPYVPRRAFALPFANGPPLPRAS